MKTVDEIIWDYFNNSYERTKVVDKTRGHVAFDNYNIGLLIKQIKEVKQNSMKKEYKVAIACYLIATPLLIAFCHYVFGM